MATTNYHRYSQYPSPKTRNLDSEPSKQVQAILNDVRHPKMLDDSSFFSGTLREQFGEASVVVTDHKGTNAEEHLLTWGRYSCIAYKQDAIWYSLKDILTTNKRLVCRPFFKDKSLYYSTRVLTYRQSITDKTRKICALWFFVPAVLINPDPLMPKWLKENKEQLVAEDGLVFILPPFPLSSPLFTWLFSGLAREAAYLSSSGELVSKLLLEFADNNKDLLNLVMEKHCISSAAKIWRKLRSILLAQADKNSSMNACWFNPKKGKKIVQHTAAEIVYDNTYVPMFSSIHEFERMVMRGGWPAVAQIPYKTWSLHVSKHDVHTHGETTGGWESLLRAQVEKRKKPYIRKPKIIENHLATAQEAFNLNADKYHPQAL